MCYLRHRFRIFLFRRKVTFRSQDIQTFAFLTIPWFSKSVTSWRVLDMTQGAILIISFEPQLINPPNLVNDRYKQGQYFSETFWTICRTGDKFEIFFSLAMCSNYWITKYVKIPVFHFFEKVNKGQLKIVNLNY